MNFKKLTLLCSAASLIMPLQGNAQQNTSTNTSTNTSFYGSDKGTSTSGGMQSDTSSPGEPSTQTRTTMQQGTSTSTTNTTGTPGTTVAPGTTGATGTPIQTGTGTSLGTGTPIGTGATVPSDSMLSQQITEKLSNMASGVSTNVQVNSANGVVTITGRAESAAQKSAIENMVRSMHGVKKIDSRLTIQESENND